LVLNKGKVPDVSVFHAPVDLILSLNRLHAVKSIRLLLLVGIGFNVVEDGHIYTMGSNSEGRLGIGDKTIEYASAPCMVESLFMQKPR
jgi:hypothetical protein